MFWTVRNYAACVFYIRYTFRPYPYWLLYPSFAIKMINRTLLSGDIVVNFTTNSMVLKIFWKCERENDTFVTIKRFQPTNKAKVTWTEIWINHKSRWSFIRFTRWMMYYLCATQKFSNILYFCPQEASFLVLPPPACLTFL